MIQNIVVALENVRDSFFPIVLIIYKYCLFNCNNYNIYDWFAPLEFGPTKINGADLSHFSTD